MSILSFRIYLNTLNLDYIIFDALSDFFEAED